jgi:hypothetical protein
MRRLAALLLGSTFALACSTEAPTAAPGDARLARLEGADQGGKLLTATLLGANEVPGPGDPDGSGTARITVNNGQSTICYEITVSGIAPATMAHIHLGGPTVSGPVVQGLIAPTNGSSSGCIETTNERLLEGLRKNPENYYVNVHNREFPGGAIRGQLD